MTEETTAGIPPDPDDPGIRTPTADAAPAAPTTRRANRAMQVLAVLVTIYVATWAKSIVVPIVIAVLTALVLAPATRLLTRLCVPRVIAAFLVVSAALGSIAALGSVLVGPAAGWIERAPQTLRRLEYQLAAIREPIEAATDATERLLDGRNSPQSEPSPLASSASAFLIGIIEDAPVLIAMVVATVFLVILLLLHGEQLLRKAITLAPSLSARKGLITGTRTAQHDLSRYLLTISAINVALGALVATGLHLAGVPDALLWGGLAAVLNFAPYAGAVVTAAILLLVGLAEYDGLGALLPLAIFVPINVLEGQLVTPLLVGRRLHLDPIIIVLALLVLGWMWGIAGVLVAVPLLACAKLIAVHVAGGEAWAILLTDPRGLAARNGA